jgi:hypothetical protein
VCFAMIELSKQKNNHFWSSQGKGAYAHQYGAVCASAYNNFVQFSCWFT